LVATRTSGTGGVQGELGRWSGTRGCKRVRRSRSGIARGRRRSALAAARDEQEREGRELGSRRGERKWGPLTAVVVGAAVQQREEGRRGS